MQKKVSGCSRAVIKDLAKDMEPGDSCSIPGGEEKRGGWTAHCVIHGRPDQTAEGKSTFELWNKAKGRGHTDHISEKITCGIPRARNQPIKEKGSPQS